MTTKNHPHEVVPALNLAVIPQEWLDRLNEKLDLLTSIQQEKAQSEIDSQWIESTKARKLLGVSQKTWQNYRNERRIPFSQFGRKIYVKRSDLEAFMQSNYISAR